MEEVKFSGFQNQTHGQISGFKLNPGKYLLKKSLKKKLDKINYHLPFHHFC